MRLLANLAWLLTLGEVVEWLGAVLEELDFQNEAKNQSRGRSELQAAGLDIATCHHLPILSWVSMGAFLFEFPEKPLFPNSDRFGRQLFELGADPNDHYATMQSKSKGKEGEALVLLWRRNEVEGHQVTAGDASLSAAERLEVMTSLVRAYAHGLFVSGHFNGDPHAGNLLVTRKNGKAQCVLLDWGLTKELTNQRRLAACKLIVAVGMKDTNGIVEAFREMGMNFSANADPEPELLLTILRHISLIEHKTESRRIEAKFGQTMEKAIYHKMGLHSKVDSYTGDFFFIFRVASLIKGLATVLDIRAQFLEIFIEVSRGVLAGPRPRPAPSLAVHSNAEARLAREAQRALQSGAVGCRPGHRGNLHSKMELKLGDFAPAVGTL
ncbi:Adck1 [Symbiodinium microadriaticum]|nr:Adck1 [Symbiodinium microadriaticum]